MKKIICDAFEKKFAYIQKISYDKKEQLVYENITGRNYHTAITNGRVHRTRENTEYAMGLLQIGAPEAIAAAENIFSKVLALQDTDPQSNTYGIWPYLFEEPLDQMLNPDWNWASFIGRTLVMALLDYSDALSLHLQQNMKQALRHTCISIMRRNMGVDYTNICIMSSFVIAVSGEILQNKDFVSFGLDKLRRLMEFIDQNGSICEYNSPYYGLIDLEENGRILRYARTPGLQNTAEQLNRVLWRDMAQHFHHPTGQLAPPHTRCYENILGDRLLSIFEIGTMGVWNLLEGRTLDLDLLWPLSTLVCPTEYIPQFAPLREPHEVSLQYYKGVDTIHDDEVRVLTEKGQRPITATTWLHPAYCLGSFDRHDLWNQRRPLMAYLKNGEAVTAFRVRCMHDDMDFASAIISTAQIKNDTVSAIGFVTDHGDYHYILDPMQDASITANKFSIRFELSGCMADTSIEELDGDYIFRAGDVRARLRILHVTFDGHPVVHSIYKTIETVGLELILQQAPDTRICFHAIRSAAVLFALHFYALGESAQMPDVQMACNSTKLQGVLQHSGGQSAQTAWVNATPDTYTDSITHETKIFKNGGFLYE